MSALGQDQTNGCVARKVYAIYGDAPFVYMARETAFFLLRQLSVVRDLIGGIRSFNLF